MSRKAPKEGCWLSMAVVHAAMALRVSEARLSGILLACFRSETSPLQGCVMKTTPPGSISSSGGLLVLGVCFVCWPGRKAIAVKGQSGGDELQDNLSRDEPGSPQRPSEWAVAVVAGTATVASPTAARDPRQTASSTTGNEAPQRPTIERN